MKVYAMTALTVHDDRWVLAYPQAVTPLVHKRGGKYLVRTPNVTKKEGSGPVPAMFALIEWPSMGWQPR